MAHKYFYITFALSLKFCIMNYFKPSLCLMLSIFFLQSCSSDELLTKGTHWTEDAVRSSLKFMKVNNGFEQTRSIDEVEDNNLSITLGRPSKSCGGFGICEISKPYKPKPIVLPLPFEPVHSTLSMETRSSRSDKSIKNAIETVFSKETDSTFTSLLLLEESPNKEIPKDMLNLKVDDEIIVPTSFGDLYLEPGVIIFNPNIGRFGGYKLNLFCKKK